MADEQKGKKGELETTSGGRSMSPFEEMDRLFEEMMPRRWMRRMGWERPGFPELARGLMGYPSVDVIDRDNEVLVRAELPGVKKDDIEISATEDSVTIEGKVEHEDKEEKGNYYRSELTRGTFSRTVALPGVVDSDNTKAKFDNGVLEIHMPKVEGSKRRTVKVE